jgi:error-prone DNA polymerase
MTPLTVRSHYSLMWGTCAPAAVCAAARQRGYSRLALTDTDNLYGLWPFLDGCAAEGLQPIVGAEVTAPNAPLRAVCLVENPVGYRNLCGLITRRHCDPDFDLESGVTRHADGLVVLTRSPELLARWHHAGLAVYGALARRPDGAALRLRQAARRLGVPTVATPGSFFLDPAEFSLHRVLRAIAGNTTLDRLPAGAAAPADAWLAPAEVYRRRFAPWPDALRAGDALAERLSFGGPPRRLLLPPWNGGGGRPAGERLRAAAYAGARRRYGADLCESVVERLEHELGIIDRMGFAAYFLVVRDIVARSPRICGRGSGAASLVAYCLGITNVCPIQHNLYFERFLNPGRTDPPDIDIDFAWDERDAVLAEVLARHGAHAAMVCSHIGFQPRMAIRETARVFGLAEGEIGRVSRRLPWFWRAVGAGEDLLQRLKGLPELGGIDFPQPWPRIVGIAQRLIGIPRHIAVHPGGVVITPEPVAAYVPVQPAAKGVPVIQWEKEGAEAGGLVKIDLLGNRSLGVIRDTLANLRRNRVAFDEAHWDPEQDPATRARLARGETMGCFYIESPATRLLQQKTGVGDFEHLVIHSSIIRPAANALIREYVRRLRGGPWQPAHPLLADVLAETYGIMVYQEDVSRAAVALAGFSDVDADGLRKVMAKKDRARRLEDYRQRFAAGARTRGLSAAQIATVWKMMLSFAGYSFCKPHSASYARVSFQAAYLKTHFPAEFMAAVISNQGGFYSTFAYVSEARRMGLTVRPPDVNRSAVRWRGCGRALRVGWLSLKALGVRTPERIVAARRQRPYSDIGDFLERVRPDDAEARALVHAGAFDGLHPGVSRAALLWEVARWQGGRRRGPETPELFGRRPRPQPPDLPPETEIERLRRAFAVLGFLCDRHPMALYAGAPALRGVVKAAALAQQAGRQVRVAGLLITAKVVHTRRGEPMEFVTFEDETGLVEATFFPAAYRRFCTLLDRNRPLLLEGRVEEDFGAHTLTVGRVAPLAVAAGA